MSRSYIVAYHSIYHDSYPLPSSCCLSTRRRLSFKKFAEQVEWMTKVGSFVSLENLLNHRNGKKSYQFSLTFDDGYRDTLEAVIPFLHKANIPVTWFVTSRFVEDNQYVPWWDLVDGVMKNGPKIPNIKTAGSGVSQDDIIILNHKKWSRKQLIKEFLNASPELENEMRRSLAQEYNNTNRMKNYCISEKELKAAAGNSLIDFGGHGVTHANMTKCNDSQVAHEIGANKKYLESVTGKKIEWFSYPYGAEGFYNHRIAKAVSNFGYKGALTTIPGAIGPESDILALPRISVMPSWGLKEFAARIKMVRFWRYYRKVKRKIKTSVNIEDR